MDEKETESFGNISSQNLEKSFNDLTPCDLDASSEFDDSAKEQQDVELHETILTLPNHTSSDKFSPSQTDSLCGLDTDTNVTDREIENKDLEGFYDYASNHKVHGNQELIMNAKIVSPHDNAKENLDMSLVLSEEIASIEISAASNLTNRIHTTKSLRIPLDEEKNIISHEANSNLQIEPIIDTELLVSGSEIRTLDEINAIEIVPENINETYNTNPNIDILNSHIQEFPNNENEETIFNRDDQNQQTSIQSSPDPDINRTPFENKIVQNESLQIEVPNLNSSDHLIRSKSVAELSTARTNKPNSLAEDAKLVKFSVSSKSVNIMQSNAQFLNKSRNFLNFITEKSTNIMEKTLLPQNIAAKYNSILRLTENNPTGHKKSIEEPGSSCDSEGINSMLTAGSGLENNYQMNDKTASKVTGLDIQDSYSNDLHNREIQDKFIPGDGSSQDSTEEHQKLFSKCLVNENISNQAFTPNRQESETTTANASVEINAENMQVKSDFDTSNMTKQKNMDSLNFVDITSKIRGDSNVSDETFIAIPEKGLEGVYKNNKTGKAAIGEKDLIKEHKIGDMVLTCTSESNATILPSLDTVSIESLGQEMENQRLAAANSNELYVRQLETLEKTIEQLRHDLKQATANQELINKEYVLANKERESMVMKYAISEKQLIDTQRAREYAERKVNEALKEQELLHTKLKQVQGERTRICNILDGKCHELTDAQKEVDRLKEELSMREVKLKWTQNKLKAELETHKENQQKLDKAMLRINEMKEECDQVRKESQETIRKFQQSEENKAVTLDHQLKEQQARLILERHVTEDKESSRLQLQKEVETLKQRQHALIEENNTLSLKVQNLEKERLNYENNLSNLKVIADQRQKEIVDLVGKVSQLETLKLQLKHKEELLSSNEAEVERLRQSNTELQADMEWCREREAHMLEFTQKLTDKNVRLQSEFTSMEAKNEQLELEQGPLHEQIKELSSKVKTLEISLASEKSKRTEECELLARHVAEQTQLARNFAQKLEDSQGENAVLRRKQQISVKEMTKELQQCKKRLDAFETSSPNNSLDRTSRTGSSSSLSTGETPNGTVSDNSNSGDHNILQSVEPDRQTLIDRIVKLQRIRVRQAEKLDFLEEHTRTLVNELQKKTKIIKNYILHENPHAMGSNERDRNKAELARHGGIMASVYNQRVSDDNMTLELSLEINQKLQAVLEDTLLKNITLKDNIDTLGGEIARLTMQNKRRQ